MTLVPGPGARFPFTEVAMQRVVAVLFLFVSAWTLACAPDEPEASEPAAVSEAQIAELRAAAERFRDVEAALEAGYIRDPMDMCETAAGLGRPAEEGAMGVHYFRPDLLQITEVQPRVTGTGTHTDFLEPAILLYEPQADGSLELMGVENLVFRSAWGEAGNTEPPSFQGIPYDYMEDDPATEADEAHGFAPHYDLHVWLFRGNPRGMFEPFNPEATCEHHVQEAAGAD